MLNSLFAIALMMLNAHAKNSCVQNFCLNERVAYKTSFGKIVAVDAYNQKANVKLDNSDSKAGQYDLKALYKTKGCLKGEFLRFCVGDKIPYDTFIAGYSVGILTKAGQITNIDAGGIYDYQTSDGSNSGSLLNYRQIRITKYSSQFPANDRRRGRLLAARSTFAFR